MGGVLSVPNYFGKDYSPCTILPNPEKKRIGAMEFWLRSLVTSDYKSAIAVACISLPLSCALAIASGAGPNMGLVAAMYGPIIQGVFGGSEYNILGPAGALVNINQGLAVNHGEEILPYVAMLAGILSFFCAIFHVGQFCMKIEGEPAVLEGFSFAVAMTIGLGQLNNIFGLEGLKRKAMFHQNFGSSMRALFSNEPGTFKQCAWYDNDKEPGVQEWRCESGFQWAEFVAFLLTFTLLCEVAQNKGKGMVLGTKIGEYLNDEGRNRKPWLFFLALGGIAIGAIFENTANGDVDSVKRKSEAHFPLLLKHKYPAMVTMTPKDIMANNKHFDYSFTWDWESSNGNLSLPWIFIGGLEVAFVAVLETIVSAILGQQKKCRFTKRTEYVEGAAVEDEIMPEDKMEQGSKLAASETELETQTTGVSSPTEATTGDANSEANILENKPEEKLLPIPPFQPTNETFGLALSNFASGFCGGLPCTGVLLRTEVNAETGAESKASQWLNGIMVLVVSVALLEYFAYLPFFVIAAMLARSAIGLGQGAYRCLFNELIPHVKAARENEDVDTNTRIYAYFDLANFFVVFLICLFIDGAIGLSVGFVGKYVCWKICEYHSGSAPRKSVDLSSPKEMMSVQK